MVKVPIGHGKQISLTCVGPTYEGRSPPAPGPRGRADICRRISRYPRECHSVFKDDAVLRGNAVREQG